MSKNDSGIELICILIGITFTIIVYIFKLIFKIIQWIFSLFNNEPKMYFSEEENIKPKKYKLKNLGLETPNCPYCNIILPKLPQRKTKCKNCGNYIYSRSRPSDGKKVLLREDELKILQIEWEKKNGIYEIRQAERNKFELEKLYLMKVRNSTYVPDNDVYWSLYQKDRLIYANKGDWYNYGYTTEQMANVLFNEKRYSQAIELYLEAQYFDVCCNGCQNGFLNKKSIKQHHIGFQVSDEFAECIEKEQLRMEDLQKIFNGILIANAPFTLTRQEAWKYMSKNISENPLLCDLLE